MRHTSSLLSVAAAALTLALGAPAAAATLSVGWNEGCAKSTCFNENGVFTQSFSAKDFGAGPVSIGQLLLERGVLGSLDGSTFRLSFALNGETLGTWGQYTMAGIGGDWLTFGGENFSWNPEDGDLVLILALVPPPKPGAGGGFFASSFQEEAPLNDGPPRQPQPLDSPDSQDERQTTAVPEPGAWALMITGFGLSGAAFRQRRRMLVA